MGIDGAWKMAQKSALAHIALGEKIAAEHGVDRDTADRAAGHLFSWAAEHGLDPAELNKIGLSALYNQAVAVERAAACSWTEEKWIEVRENLLLRGHPSAVVRLAAHRGCSPDEGPAPIRRIEVECQRCGKQLVPACPEHGSRWDRR